MNLLVCEDDPTIARLLSYVLSFETDIQVMMVEDRFDQVIDGTEWDYVDVILVDSHLPGVEGADLLQWVRDAFPHIRRVMFTGDNSQTLTSSGADYVIHKPGSLEDLISAVRGL